MKHFDVLSVAKIGAIIGLVFGIIEGIIIGIFAAAAAGSMMRGFHPMFGAGIAGIVIFFAIVVGLIGGFVGGAIAAFVYNCAAKYVGSVEVDLDAKM